MVYEGVQYGVEAEGASGVAVAATKKLLTLGIKPSIQTEANEFTPSGSKYRTVVVHGKEWTAASVDGAGSYTDLVVPFSGLFGNATITTPGGGTLTRDWAWSPSTFSPDIPRTFTIETGSGYGSERFVNGLFTGFGMTFNRGGVTVSGALIGQLTTEGITLSGTESQTVTITGSPTGGSFTLTFNGQTTATILYNAVAATVQTALEGLSNISVGDVVVTGGPGPGTPYVVQFTGQYAATNVAQMTAAHTFTGGTTPNVAVTTTTAGGVTSLTMRPIVPNQVNVYLDTTAAGIGTTKLTRAMECGFNIADKYGAFWPLNTSNTSYGGTVEKVPTAEASVTLGLNTQSTALLTALRAGDTRFMRIEAVGKIIEGALTERLWVDLAVQNMPPGEKGDSDGLVTRPHNFAIIHDSTWTRAMQITLRTDVTAL